MVDVIGSGAWVKTGPIGPAIPYWALPDEELLALPGYRMGADREADKAEARRLYEAAGSPDIPLIWFADVPDYIRAYAPTYITQIKQVPRHRKGHQVPGGALLAASPRGSSRTSATRAA